MRDQYQEELRSTKQKVLDMAERVKEELELLAEALESHRDDLLPAMKDLEEKVFFYDHEIEKKTVLLLLQEQPVAGDLRLVTAMLKMHRNLLRMAMQIYDAAALWELVEDKGSFSPKDDIKDMLVLAQTMVVGAMKSFAEGNERLGKDVIQQDDALDALFEHVKKVIVKQLKKGHINPEVAIHGLLMSKYFEKIGDHACEFASQGLYVMTGEDVSSFFS